MSVSLNNFLPLNRWNIIFPKPGNHILLRKYDEEDWQKLSQKNRIFRISGKIMEKGEAAADSLWTARLQESDDARG